MKRLISSRQEPPAYSIAEAIRQAKIDLDCAYTNFNHALEQDLIDCYIYQLKSAQMRYRFLLNCAKQGDTAVYKKGNFSDPHLDSASRL